MASALADRWTFLDRLIQAMRYRKVTLLIPEGSVLADLGCGDGDFLRHVSGRISSGYGVDAKIKSPVMDSGHLVFKEADLDGRIPIEDESVDVVTALAVLEHLRRPESFVEEIFRVLKPGGLCILTTPSPAAKPLLEFLAFRLRMISERDIRDHKHYFDKGELRRLFIMFSEVKTDNFQFGLNTVITARK